eukprot:250885-Hanusia_phi.AAC.2
MALSQALDMVANVEHFIGRSRSLLSLCTSCQGFAHGGWLGGSSKEDEAPGDDVLDEDRKRQVKEEEESYCTDRYLPFSSSSSHSPTLSLSFHLYPSPLTCFRRKKRWPAML